MGSATTQALAATRATLDAASGVDLEVARELFAAAHALGGSSQLSGALSDAAASTVAREKVVRDVFGRFRPASVAVLSTAATQRWSSSDEFVTGIEELAIRAAAIAAPDADVEAELFQIARVVAANPELELALGSRLGDATAKGALIEKIVAGRTGEATTLIASSLVQQSRERRARSLLSWALRLVADQRGRAVATVVTASALDDAQRARLQSALTQRYGTEISLNDIVDPQVVGGLRVEVGDEIIDATVSTRLHDLRQRLAG
jgi:F-type H+-transporting ATPase subunit delta